MKLNKQQRDSIKDAARTWLDVAEADEVADPSAIATFITASWGDDQHDNAWQGTRHTVYVEALADAIHEAVEPCHACDGTLIADRLWGGASVQMTAERCHCTETRWPGLRGEGVWA